MTNQKLKLNEGKLSVLKVKDKTDKLTISVNRLFDLPFRLVLTGKSGSGKGGIITNICLNENYGYKKVFNDIYIFAPEPYADEKMKVIIEEKEIPESNIFEDIEELEDLYDMLVEDFKDRVAEGEKPKMPLLIIDDLAFSGKLANRFNALAKVMCNSRKFMISCIITAQAYTQTAKNIRLQASAMIIFQTSNKELEIIETENNYLRGGKKSFYNMFRSAVLEKHDFLCINYSNNYDELYLDKKFRPLAEVINSKDEDKSPERMKCEKSSQQQEEKKNSKKKEEKKSN
tara:strand:+ start:248 stop:1108 length:861 start_codon:yes stop_codon:yes gene_type:complete